MRGTLVILAGVFLALCICFRVQAADPSTLACKVYDADADVPEAVGTLMDRYGDRAARACIDAKGKLATYSSLSAVAHNRFSVCQFEEIPRPAGVVSKTNRSDIVTFMLVLEGECPARDDNRYVAAQHVSAGLFVALARFWEDLARSEKSFDAAFSLLSAEQRAAPVYADVKERFLKKKSAPRLRHITLQAGALFGAYEGYVLEGRDDSPEAITIFVELTDSGLKTMAVGRNTP